MMPLLLGLGLLFVLGSARGGGARGQRDACAGTATQARGRGVDALIAWAICAGRQPADVAQLLALMREDGRAADAARVEAAWNRRLELDDEAPDGTLSDPSADRRAVSTLEGSGAPPVEEPPPTHGGSFTVGPGSVGDVPPGAPAGFNDAEARRLAPMVARSLRSGGGYRTVLRRFQTAAGIPADGLYGPISRAALRWFGVDNPPPALANRSAPEQYQPYTWGDA